MMWLMLIGCLDAIGEETERFDVHQAMRSGSQESCALCHEEGGALKSEPAKTCEGCHYRDSHAGTAEHLVVLDGDMAAFATQAGLPLAEGRATCNTCHDSHPAGSTEHRPAATPHPAVPADWQSTLLAGQPVLGNSDTLRLPLADGQLCKACHGTGPSPVPRSQR